MKRPGYWQKIRGWLGMSQERESDAGTNGDRSALESHASSSRGLYKKIEDLAQKADPERLIPCLANQEEAQMTAMILEEMGERAVPALLKFLDDPALKCSAVEVLGKIGSETALPNLLALVAAAEFDSRDEIRRLWSFDEGFEEPTRPEPELLARLLWALGEIGKAEAAVPVRKALESAFYQFSPRASGSIQTQSVFFEIRRHGVEALGKLEPFDDQDALEFLIAGALDTEDPKLPEVGKRALVRQIQNGNERIRKLTEEFSCNPDRHVARTFTEISRRL